MTINAINLITKTASCPAFGDWAISKGITHKYSEAKKGDIYLFDINGNGTSDHIGIIYKVNKDGSVETIEGNTSKTSDDNGGNVMKRARYKGLCNYLVRPKYTSDVTADMVIATAMAEVGTKESPANSNRQKYGAWIGANGEPWCCAFICWCFAHVIGEAKPIEKPSGKYTGDLPASTIKEGSTGSEVKKWQKFLNWYHADWNLEIDGEFGGLTGDATMQFQATEGLEDDGCAGPLTRTAAKKYLAEKASTTPKKDALIATAKKLAWAKGTAKSTYYSKPKEAFKTALETAYPNHSKWGVYARDGKSCDVALGVIVRTSGVDKSFPRGHDEQWDYLKKHTELYKEIALNNAEPGDIVTYKRNDGGVHTGLITGKYFAEASYGDFFLAIRDVKKSRLSASGKKSIKVYRVIEDKSTDSTNTSSDKTVKKQGVDISYIQGKLADSEVTAIKKKLDFVILRLGIRLKPKWINTVDDVFEYNYKQLEGKVPMGAYFYSRAITKTEAEEEAIFCIEQVQNKNFEYPIYLDVEDNLRQNRLSKFDLTNVINAWCSAMKSAGIPFGVYASMSWLNSKIDVSKLPSDCSIWVAQYPSGTASKSAYTGKHDIWQYTSSGKVTGLTGKLDMNYCYKEF